MISCPSFFEALQKRDLTFFAGVPDSLLKDFCSYVTDALPASRHVITANEGSAVALATGYHLATGKIPVVYLQNSGVGNMVNPLLSLADPEVYGVPMLLVVGWRGEPNVKDEPQHVKQGRVMPEMFRSMEIPGDTIGPDSKDFEAQLDRAVVTMREKRCPYVLSIRKDTFDAYKLKTKEKNPYVMTREAAIEAILDAVGADDVVVATTGKASRELYELRQKRGEKDRADFLVVGSMGHCSQIALGVALEKPNKRVFCLDGDGAAIMHMGGFTTIGRLAPKNLFHILINNGAHESVGGQSTGAFALDWSAIAKASGYVAASTVDTADTLKQAVAAMTSAVGPLLLEVRTCQGSRADLGRPKSTPLENKNQFMRAVAK